MNFFFIQGRIVDQFLRGNLKLPEYLADLVESANNYNGFQFIGLERNKNGNYKMGTLTNQLVSKIEPTFFEPGIYVFGNSPPNLPFQKVLRGKELLSQFIESFDFENNTENELIDELLKIGRDTVLNYPDKQIEIQQQTDDYMPLCSLFVRYPNNYRYGTRSHTIFLVDNKNNATFYECRMADFPKENNNAVWDESIFHFKLDEN